MSVPRTPFDTELAERLLRYCATDSQSDETSPTRPSTARQLEMARLLAAELGEIGAAEVRITDYGAVLATLPARVEGAPTLGLLAHFDTAPAYAAAGVKPRLLRDWDGSEITFPDAPGLRLSPAASPYLASRAGHDLITASGATLLGADDKAGVAILMTAARALLADPSARHGRLRLAFTPDEEIGRGVDPALPGDLGAEFAYTLDGGAVGELEWESFSADMAEVRITGVSAHPGAALGKLVNALNLAAKIVATLPQATLTPETTAGRDGFLHLYEMEGTAAEARLKLILRDFELEGLDAKAALLRQVCAAVAAGEPRARIKVEIRKQYRNMRYWLQQDMRPVELARRAYAACGLTPSEAPIRGGTDGSRLTELGVPCPNLFTGMQEIHGPLEWVSVQDMGLATRMVLQLVAEAAQG